MHDPHFFSLGCKLSNKTNCSPFGARLLGQMVPQSAGVFIELHSDNRAARQLLGGNLQLG